MSPERALLVVHAGATLAMVGVIWFVQLVHYPLMAQVAAPASEAFPAYEARNVERTGWVVVPLMLTELATLTALLWLRPPGLDATWLGAGAACLLLAWGTTFALSVPAHTRLGQAWDPLAHARLVRTNWLRTLAWSARGLLVLGALA